MRTGARGILAAGGDAARAFTLTGAASPCYKLWMRRYRVNVRARREEEVPVLLGLGANLGAPLRQLAEAIRQLSAVLAADLAVSGVYRSAPVGFAEQPPFLNLVCAGRTVLLPRQLLAHCREVERGLGRTRSFRNAPRTLDVDLLDYGGATLDDSELTLPHPRLHLRPFVLIPIAELRPAWRHPLLGRTAAELLADLSEEQRREQWVERLGPLPWQG